MKNGGGDFPPSQNGEEAGTSGWTDVVFPPYNEGKGEQSGADAEEGEDLKFLSEIAKINPVCADDIRGMLEANSISLDEAQVFADNVRRGAVLEERCNNVGVSELLTTLLGKNNDFLSYIDLSSFLTKCANSDTDWTAVLLNDPDFVTRAEQQLDALLGSGDKDGGNIDAEPNSARLESLRNEVASAMNPSGDAEVQAKIEAMTERQLENVKSTYLMLVEIANILDGHQYFDDLTDLQKKKIEEAGLADKFKAIDSERVSVLAESHLDDVKALLEGLKKIDFSEPVIDDTDGSAPNPEDDSMSPEREKLLNELASVLNADNPEDLDQLKTLNIHELKNIISFVAVVFDIRDILGAESYDDLSDSQKKKIDEAGLKDKMASFSPVIVNKVSDERLSDAETLVAELKKIDFSDTGGETGRERTSELVGQIESLDADNYDKYKDSQAFKDVIAEADTGKLEAFVDYLTKRKELVERCSNLPDDFVAFVQGNLKYSELGGLISVAKAPVPRALDSFTIFSTSPSHLDKAQEQLSEALSEFPVPNPDVDGTGGESAEDKEKLAQKREVVSRLLGISNVQKTLAKLGLSETTTLEEVDKILMQKDVDELRKFEEELNMDRPRRWTNEQLEGLRKMTFGQWFEIAYGDNWGSDNFFEAPREQQREAMRRYMEIFEPDANYEIDRGPMIQALMSVDLITATMKGLELDENATPADVQGKINSMSGDELNKLYHDVKGGKFNARPAPVVAPRPVQPAPVVAPQPGGGDDSGPVDGGNDDGLSDPKDGEPTSVVDSIDDSDPGAADAKKYDALLDKYSKEKMPASEADVLRLASSDARCLGMIDRQFGGDRSAFAADVLQKIEAWNNASDDMKRDFLSSGFAGFMSDAGPFEDFVYLAKLGIIPDPSKI